MALILIGSMADSTYNRYSDIDLVWIKPRKLGYKRLKVLENGLSLMAGRPVQLVQFTLIDLRRHFKDRSTMAHSIHKGVIIYSSGNPNFASLYRAPLGLPDINWMREWYQHWLRLYNIAYSMISREKHWSNKLSDKTGTVDDTIARVCVNFAILYLEKKGFVPVSRRQISLRARQYLSHKDFQGLRLALKYSGKDTAIPLEQAETILRTTRLLKSRLRYLKE